MAAPVEGVEFTLTTAGTIVLGSDIIVAEVDRCDASRDGDTGCTVGNNSREWSRSGRGVANRTGEGDGFAIIGNINGECISRDRSSNRRWLGGLCAKFVQLEESADLSLTAGPIGLCGDFSAGDLGERIW